MIVCKSISDASKGYSILCYIVGCSKTVTTSIKLPLNEKFYCIIPVCDSCLSKYVARRCQSQ